jgi:hypothetical protein
VTQTKTKEVAMPMMPQIRYSTLPYGSIQKVARIKAKMDRTAVT